MKTNLAVIESDSVIASMTRASHALAEAVNVSQTKTIIDVARAAEIYAKRQHLSESAISQATSVKVEAMRKLGEILKATPKATGTAGTGRPNLGGAKKELPKSATPTLDELGLSKKESAVAQQLASLSEDAFEQVREGSVTIAKALAAVKAGKEKPRSAATPASEPAPDYSDQLAEAQNAITDLAAENERLNDRLAVEAMDASEEEKTAAAEIIADLRHQVMTLTAELDAMRISRDTFQAENSELMKQVQRNQRELKKLKEGV